MTLRSGAHCTKVCVAICGGGGRTAEYGDGRGGGNCDPLVIRAAKLPATRLTPIPASQARYRKQRDCSQDHQDPHTDISMGGRVKGRKSRAAALCRPPTIS